MACDSLLMASLLQVVNRVVVASSFNKLQVLLTSVKKSANDTLQQA